MPLKNDGSTNSGGEKIALEAVSEHSAIVPFFDVDLDLGNLILFGMGETIRKLRVLAGTDKPVVDLGHGIELKIEEQNCCQPWRDRLVMIQDAVCAVVDANPCLDAGEVSRAVLEADGWSWTRVTFRTPMWLLDHAEVLHLSVMQEFEVLSWLAQFSSETR